MAQNIVIVGAGVAGLACAVDLARAGRSVTIIEAAPEPGGRARAFAWREAGSEIDTGPHLIMGCYREFRSTLAAIGVRLEFPAETTVEMTTPQGHRVRIPVRAGRSLRPLFAARGLTSGSRLRLAYGLARTKRLADTTYVEEWLNLAGQRGTARAHFWEPFVTSALNRRPAAGLSRHLATVLARAFLRRDADARVMAAPAGLSALYARPAVDFIQRAGGSVRFRETVVALECRDSRFALRTNRDRRVEADGVVLAVPPDAAQELLPGRSLPAFRPSPIVSVHLLLSSPLPMPAAGFLGLVGSPFHWAFQSNAAGERSVVSLIASDAADLAECAPEELSRLARSVLAAYFREWEPAQVLAVLPVKERRATWHLHDPRALPPAPSPGILLAGDWTDPELPCTIEAAAASGRRAAHLILTY